MSLTGRFTFRRSVWGRIVLQVEEEKRALWSRSKPFKKRWRDATLMDLAAPELRALIDLRYKPQFMTQHEYLASDVPTPQPVAVEPEGHENSAVARSLAEARRGIRHPATGPQDVTVELERAQRASGVLRSNANRSA